MMQIINLKNSEQYNYLINSVISRPLNVADK